MTNFKFSDGESLELNNAEIKNKQIVKIGEQSTITVIIKDYLFFISNNALTPDLPSNINIIYVNENKYLKGLTSLIKENKFLKALGKKINIEDYEYPENYAYPASMMPETSTLYISKDFNRENKKISQIKDGVETNGIVLFRNYFNQDNQKVLEYVFGHELGHFFLLSKNHKKPELSESLIIQKIARNIEEGFSEAFSIQLMFLKDSLVDIKAIKDGRLANNKKRIKFIENRELSIQEMLEHFNKIGFEEIIDSYNFKTIYDNFPLKDANGNIEKDINKIYEKCYQIAVNNNKEVIKDIINSSIMNYYGLSQQLCGLLQSTNDKENDTSKLIDNIHSKINNTSFNTGKIKMLRENFFNITKDNKLKF